MAVEARKAVERAKGKQMTDWTPSVGLKAADAVVAEIEQALEACGIAVRGHPSRPILSHRLTEIVAGAIDDSVADGGIAQFAQIPDGTVFANARVVTITNGHSRLYPGIGTEPEASEQVQTLSKSIMPLPRKAEGAGEPTTPKKRGRPKGSKKAKKPAKGDKAPEAPPAAE